jgi:hypothetical protein
LRQQEITMTAHFTPGPWQARLGRVFGSDGRAIAQLPAHQVAAYERQEANGRLIAHAPDLLSALKLLVRDFLAEAESNRGHEPRTGELPHAYHVALSVIRGAEGKDVEAEERTA